MTAASVARALHSGFGATALTLAIEYRWPVVLLGGLGALDLWWAGRVGVTVTDLGPVAELNMWVLALGLAWQSAGTMMVRHWGQGSPGRLLLGLGRGITFIGLWGATSVLAAIFSYLAVRNDFPFHDALLVRLDRMLGFDWPGWRAAVDARPGLSRLFDTAYRSLAMQFMLGFPLCAFLRGRRGAAELYWMATVSVLVACAISGLVPVLGAQPHFGVSGANWVKSLLLVRRDHPVELPFEMVTGIVSLPSYHAALGVIFAWNARGMRLLWPPIVLLNAVMIVSTLTVGGHYLVDVIAGLLLAALTILSVGHVMRRAP